METTMHNKSGKKLKTLKSTYHRSSLKLNHVVSRDPFFNFDTRNHISTRQILHTVEYIKCLAFHNGL